MKFLQKIKIHYQIKLQKIINDLEEFEKYRINTNFL